MWVTVSGPCIKRLSLHLSPSSTTGGLCPSPLHGQLLGLDPSPACSHCGLAALCFPTPISVHPRLCLPLVFSASSHLWFLAGALQASRMKGVLGRG